MKEKGLVKSIVTIFVAALILFVSNKGLAGMEKANRERYLQELLPYILPGSSTFTSEEVGQEEEMIKAVYKAETGYVIHTVANGYVNEIELLVGVDHGGEVKGLSICRQQETFGLGAGVQTNVAFLQQYLGTSGEAKTGSTVDALTGATVSSKAVSKGVNAAVAYVTGADISSGATTWGG